MGTAQAGTTGINDAATGLAAGSAEQVNAQPLSAQDIQQYMNPYVQDVAGSTAALLGQNNAQAQSGALGTAISSGAFGGDRTGIAAANLEQQQNLSNANTYAGILSQGYTNAQGVAQQQQGVNLAAGQANRAALGSAGSELASIGQTAYGEGANTASEQGALASGAQTAGLQGANAQIAAGTVQQQTQQAQDTAEYNQFLQQESYPFQVQSWLAGISEGTGALSGSTTTTTQPGGFFSDRRLKHDIKKIGKTYDNQTIYSYKMHGDPRTHIGLMAQEVEKKKPAAVGVDGRSGYKIVDYGTATDAAANRGHFYAGGVVPLRVAKAGGGPSIVDAGDLSAILQAQQSMYAPMASASGVYGGAGGSVPRGGSSRVPAPDGAVPHLVTAQGGLKQQPTGVQNLSSAAGLAKQGKDIYDDFNTKPVRHTTTTTTPGGVAPAAWSSPGANFDGSSGTVVPDTTEASVSPGDYKRGGVAGRPHYDDGGDVDFSGLVNAHGAMYGQGSGQKQEDIPSGGGGSHTLAVASGSPAPPTSGSSNLNTGLGLGQKAYQAYNHFATPSTPNAPPSTNDPWSSPGTEGVSFDGSTPVDMSGGFDGSAGAAEAAAPVAAPAADAGATAASGAGAGAAADVAGTAAAGAGADAAGSAAAEAAAAIAAEYAAADVGTVALLAARRGGRIRKGYDAGGMPYSSPDGSLDIPDTDSGAAKLQTAGPLVKQPTGLQTAMSLGSEQGATSALGSMFSNQGLARGGVAGRRGYADGGDPDDTDNTDAGPSSGLAAADMSAAPAAIKDAQAPKDKGPSWWDRNKGTAIPILQGLAAMGTAPTKHLGVALAAGLGAGASSYIPSQQGLANTRETEADITGKNISNQMAQQNLDLYKNMIASQNTPTGGGASPKPAAIGPTPVSATDIPGYYQNKYKINPNMTPQEVKNISQAQFMDKKMGTNFTAGAQLGFQNRVQQAQFQSQSGAQADYDKLVNGVVNAGQQGDSAYTNLKQINPGLADGVARQAGLDPTAQDTWNANQKATADATAAKIAAQHAAEIHQYTGSKYEGGNAVDERTNVPAVGPAAAQLTPEQRSARQLALAQPTTYGAGLPQPLGQAAGISAAPPPGTSGPPTPTVRPTAPKVSAPPQSQPATAGASPTQTLAGVDLNQIPKLPPIPAAVDQPTKARADERATSDVKIGNDTMGSLSQQAAAAARNTAIYSQLKKTLATADPREFGPSSAAYKTLQNFRTYLSGIPPDGLVNQAEADKYLTQLGVGGSKQLLGADQQLRQQEMLTLMAHANPNMDQPLQVIKNLAAYGEAGNNYDFKAANTGIAAIRNGADPYQVPGAIEAQAHRADYVNGAITTPQKHLDYLRDHPETAPLFKKKYGYLP